MLGVKKTAFASHSHKTLVLKDLTHALRPQPEDKSLMTSWQVVNIVINSEPKANADLLCGSSQRLCVG